MTQFASEVKEWFCFMELLSSSLMRGGSWKAWVVDIMAVSESSANMYCTVRVEWR